MENNSFENISCSILEKGLSDIFSRRGYNSDTEDWQILKKYLTKDGLGFVLSYFTGFDDECKTSFCLGVRDNEINLFEKDEWLDVLNKELDHLIDDEKLKTSVSNLHYSYNNRGPVYLLMLAEDKGDFNWGPIYDRMKEFSYNSSMFDRVLKNYAKQNVDTFLKDMNENVFTRKYGHHLRGKYYNTYVLNGHLTKKTARKIRSDGASAASCRGLSALFEAGETVYSSSYEELLTQFVDTKYEDVACTLADKLPFHMLSFLLGTDHWYAKSKVEKRISDFYKEKEGESNG